MREQENKHREYSRGMTGRIIQQGGLENKAIGMKARLKKLWKEGNIGRFWAGYQKSVIWVFWAFSPAYWAFCEDWTRSLTSWATTISAAV